MTAIRLVSESDAEVAPLRPVIERDEKRSLQHLRDILVNNAREALADHPQLLRHHIEVADAAADIGFRLNLPELYLKALEVAAMYHDLGGKIKSAEWKEPRIWKEEEREAFRLAHSQNASLNFIEDSEKHRQAGRLRREHDLKIISELVPQMITFHHHWGMLPQDDLMLVLSEGVLIAADKIVGTLEKRPYKQFAFSRVAAVCEVRKYFLSQPAVPVIIRKAVLRCAFEHLFEGGRVMCGLRTFVDNFERTASISL